jgi:hypothetical protein
LQRATDADRRHYLRGITSAISGDCIDRGI